MKRKLILFTALVLLSCLTAGIASASISNVRFEAMNNGETRVTWDDSDNAGPYTIVWTNSSWNDHYTQEEQSYNGTSATLKQLVPGETYSFMIMNQSSSTVETYTLPKTTFTDYTKNKKVTISQDSFDLRQESIYRTVTLRLYYPRLSKERRFVWVLALRSPLGYGSYVVCDENLKLDPRGSFAQGEFDFSVFMNDIQDTYGSIPGGDYAFEMYLDGQYYGEADFYIYN